MRAMGYLFLVLFGLAIGIGLVYFEPYSLWAAPTLLFVAFAFVIRPLWLFIVLLALSTFRLVWQAGGIAPLELAYSILFLLLIARTLIREGFSADSNDDIKGFKSPVLLPLCLFLLWAVTSAVVAWLRGHPFAAWTSDLNMIIFYAAYFIILGNAKTPRETDCLLIALILVTITAVLQSAYEEMTTRSFLTVLYGESVVKFPVASAFSLNLFLMLLPILLFMRYRRGRWFLFLLICILFGVHQILASVRSRWLGAIAALMVIFLVAPPLQKTRFLKPVFLLIFCLILLGTLSLTIPSFSRNPALTFMQMLQKRFATIFKGRLDPTTEVRFLESEAAIKEIHKHPWEGSGLGKEVSYFDTTLYYPQTVSVRYIHNSYLFFLLNMGWVGLALFLWLCGAFTVYGIRVFRSLKDPYDKGLALGCWAAFIGMLVAGFAGASLNDPALTIWVGLLMGIVAILDKRNGVLKEGADAST